MLDKHDISEGLVARLQGRNEWKSFGPSSNTLLEPKRVRCAHDYEISFAPHIRSEDVINDAQERAADSNRTTKCTLCKWCLVIGVVIMHSYRISA